MYNKISEFLDAWNADAEKMQKVFDALTDKSLTQPVADGHRTLGRIAWHTITTIPEMMAYTGLNLKEMLDPEKPVPTKAIEIAGAFRAISATLINEISDKWEDRSLLVEDDLYGERWPRRITLMVLIHHQIHHRGQMSVLMRQAGLRVPSIYGPALEDWEAYGAKAPAV